MKFFITGANGMVARAVLTHAGEHEHEAVGFTRDELDISNEADVDVRVREERPDAIINCAAWTDVDACESDVKRAYHVNADAVEILARAARGINAGFITISTDYVFDGEKDGFYTQRDDPHPLGVYGQAKLNGERRAQVTYARTIVARTGWVYGAGGTNFLSRVATDAHNFVNELAARHVPLKAIDDSYGTPTAAEDLAARLCELAALDLPGIYHVCGGGAGTTYADFARRALLAADLSDAAAQLETVSYRTLLRPAPRPVNSRMRCLLSERIGLAPLRAWDEKMSCIGR